MEIPGTDFVDFWSTGQAVIKSRLLGVTLSTSGANARTSTNRDFWDRCCCLLEPRPESHYIETSGVNFVDF